MRSPLLPLLLVAVCSTACRRADNEADVGPGPAPVAPTEIAREHDQEERGAAGDDESPAVPAGTPGAVPSEAVASSAELDAVARSLDEWAAKGKGRARLALFDLNKATWLVEWRADELENPASTQKILTAAAALELLGPAYTFRTEVFGVVEGGRTARLTVRGGGAPDLSTADLWRLAHVLVEGGLREVGAIFVDQGRFDDRFVPPAFEQQPNEWAAFRAPVSALALDRNTVELDVLPLTEGDAARVWFQPPGASTASGKVETSPKGSGDHVTWSVGSATGPGALRSELGGAIAADLGRQKYARRLDDPRLVPGLALRELLRELGVKVQGDVSLGANDGGPRLIHLDSEPVGVIVRALGKESDNFTAEMLLIALSQVEDRTTGANKAAPWSTARGALVLSQWLKERGLSVDGLVLKNGSGLFDANRLSPRVLARTLRYMWTRPSTNAEFVGQLASGGQDGTLRARFGKGPLAGRVRAKTGTLRDVSALAGYVLRADGRAPLAFAVLVNGTAGRQDEARRRIDQAVTELVARVGP